MAKKALSAGFRQRKDGKYESRFTINGKRYSVYGRTLKECKEKDAELREKIKKGLYTDNRNITLERYYQEWREARKGTVKESTAIGYDGRYKCQIQQALGHRKLVDIEKREIVKLQQELSKKYKASTVNLTITSLKSIFNSAVTDGILAKSPAAGLKPLKEHGESASVTIHRALTEEEQRIFMEYAKNEWLYELLALLLCTGLRIGEATALLWQDIDHINNVIHITKTISRDMNGKQVIGSPKTKSGNRDIPINDTIKGILKSQKAKLQLLYGNVIPMQQHVFIGQQGGIIWNCVINQNINRITGRMNQDGIQIEHFSVHALRDTFATRYIEQGGSPQTLKTILGHSSLAMTMDLYSHVLPNTKQEEMDRIKIM